MTKTEHELEHAVPEDYEAAEGEQVHCILIDERRVPIREAFIYEIPQPPVPQPGFAWVTGDIVDRMNARNAKKAIVPSPREATVDEWKAVLVPRVERVQETGERLTGPQMAARLREAADQLERCPGPVSGAWLLEIERAPIRDHMRKVVARDVSVRFRADVQGERREPEKYGPRGLTTSEPEEE